MNKHFIKEIEIKNFKCFKDFKAEGFGRVNLIGGKNNVGKTAFMEACYLSTTKNILDYFFKHIEFLTNRDYVNQVYDFNNKDNDINNLINHSQSCILVNKNKTKTSFEINSSNYTYDFYIQNEKIEYTYDNLFSFLNFNIKNTKQYFSNQFIVSSNSYPNFMFDYLISKTKEVFTYQKLNDEIKTIFHYDSIDILRGIPMVFQEQSTFPLHSLGQGMKTFIYNISSLLIEKDQILFFDEVDNGIHYSLFDKLWEIILTISREQNVQVFATTHSKECIESYARVAKKLKETDIKFLSLYRNKENLLKSITFGYEKIQDRIELGLDNR